MGGLKSSMVMGDKYDESLARLNIIESEINIGRNLLILIMKEIFYSQVIMVIQVLITMIFLLVW